MFPNVLGKYRLCHAPSHTTNSLDIKNTQSQTLTKSYKYYEGGHYLIKVRPHTRDKLV
jgi:hypothetical protein